jgi:malonyl CoA-acyl carrier protein transacylase
MGQSERLAILFPGQGSQAPDMRETVERHRPDLLSLAAEEVSDDLFERAEAGTRWAQPAIYCAALAGYEVVSRTHRADVMAGHSLGEIGALVAAGALDAADGLRLVAARGRLMQEAADETGDGGMMAVRARDRAGLEEVVAQTSLTIANDNAPDQLILSGNVDALDRAEPLLRERKIRAMRLPVSGAFHTELMAPAVEPFRELVAQVELREPRVPVFSCVTAEPFDNVRAQLVQALTSPVRWTDVMRSMQDRGVTHTVETGPGRVLTGLVRKSLSGVEAEAPLAMEAAGA